MLVFGLLIIVARVHVVYLNLIETDLNLTYYAGLFHFSSIPAIIDNANTNADSNSNNNADTNENSDDKIIPIKNLFDLKFNDFVNVNKSTISPILDKINNILNSIELDINNNESCEKAQIILENTFTEIKEDVLNTESEKLRREFKRIIINNYEGMLSYKKRGYIRRFGDLKDEITTIESLIIAYSIIITYYNITSITDIVIRIGKAVAYKIYENRIVNKGTYTDFKEFLDINNLPNEKIVSLGIFLIEWFIK